MEVTITIKAPELTEAIHALAAATASNIELLIDLVRVSEGKFVLLPTPGQDKPQLVDASTNPEPVPEPEAPADPEPAAEQPKETPAPAATKVVKLEDVRARLHTLMEAGKGEAVKALFSEFGVTKLTALPADKLPELMQKAEGL